MHLHLYANILYITITCGILNLKQKFELVTLWPSPADIHIAMWVFRPPLWCKWATFLIMLNIQKLYISISIMCSLEKHRINIVLLPMDLFYVAILIGFGLQTVACSGSVMVNCWSVHFWSIVGWLEIALTTFFHINSYKCLFFITVQSTLLFSPSLIQWKNKGCILIYIFSSYHCWMRKNVTYFSV